MDINELRKELNVRTVVVTFKKKNGDLREMHCTTNMNSIPPSAWPTGKMELSEDTKASTVRVFDVKAHGWRSFVFDNVIEVQ